MKSVAAFLGRNKRLVILVIAIIATAAFHTIRWIQEERAEAAIRANPPHIAGITTRPETVAARAMLGDPQQHADAVRLFEKAARKGDAVAETYLGYLYFMGIGVEKDNEAAIKWYTLAAMSKVADVQLRLGLMYLEGYAPPAAPIEVTPDLHIDSNAGSAEYWLRLGAQNGSLQALELVGDMEPQVSYFGPPQKHVLGATRENLEMARGHLRTLAAKGDADSVNMLCVSYRIHHDNPEELKRWCSVASEAAATGPLDTAEPAVILSRDPFPL